MNRLWLLLGLAVLVAAIIFGWLSAGRQAQLDSALLLADVTAPGCDAPGQVQLTLGNASDRPILTVEGVLSVADSASSEPVPIGNFTIDGPVEPGARAESCVPLDEAKIAGKDRRALVWLARATVVTFGESASR